MLGFAFSFALFSLFHYTLEKNKTRKLRLKERKCGASPAQMYLNRFNIIIKDYTRVKLLKSGIHKDKIVSLGFNQTVPVSM